MSEQTAAPAAGDPTPAPPVRPSHGRKNVMDMVRSLALIGGMVAVIVLLVPQSDQAVVQPVDLQGAVKAAEFAADVPVVVPELGEQWRVTSARRDRPVDGQPATWHIGYLTPSEGYAGLEVADAVDRTWVERVTSAGTEAGTQDVDGTPWRVFESQEPRRTSLLLEQDGRTTVVTGSAVLDELVEVAAAASRP